MAGYHLRIRSRNKRGVHSIIGNRHNLDETNHFVTFFSRYQSFHLLSNICLDNYQEDTALLNSFFPGSFSLLGNYSTHHELPVLPMRTTTSLISGLEDITMMLSYSHKQLILLLSHTLFLTVAILYTTLNLCFVHAHRRTILSSVLQLESRFSDANTAPFVSAYVSKN